MKLMRKALAFLVTVILAMSTMDVPLAHAGGQPFQAYAGVYDAFGYNWTAVPVSQGGQSTGGTYSIQLLKPGVVLPSGNVIYPFKINANGAYAPISIGLGANNEIVTPTTESNCGAGAPNYACTITATFVNGHATGDPVSSGTFGLQEAINAAFASGGSPVSITNGWRNAGGTTAMILAASYFSNVDLVSNDGSSPAPLWAVQPTTLSVLATPATRSATAGATQVISGTALGTWPASTEHVCVTYVDVLGGESPCSADFSFTATASVALNFASPAASTGAVGWRAYAGLATTTEYQLPISSSTCTVSTLVGTIAACAIGSAGVFPTPSVVTQLTPGVVAATYNPNTQSHTTFAYEPTDVELTSAGFQTNYGPFPTTGALTGGQLGVLATVPLPAGELNSIGRTIRMTGNISLTPTTGGTIQVLGAIGDITDFTTGTPKAVCTDTETTATGTAAIKVHFECTWTTNAIGTTGSIMPGGFMLEQLQAGTTTGNLAVESATGAITADVQNQDSIYIVFLQTTAAETAGVKLLDLHLETL